MSEVIFRVVKGLVDRVSQREGRGGEAVLATIHVS